MARRKSLVVGHQMRPAGKARKCRHNKAHHIKRGEILIEVREGLRWKGYCAACAKSMIAIARDTLADIEKAFED